MSPNLHLRCMSMLFLGLKYRYLLTCEKWCIYSINLNYYEYMKTMYLYDNKSSPFLICIARKRPKALYHEQANEVMQVIQNHHLLSYSYYFVISLLSYQLHQTKLFFFTLISHNFFLLHCLYNHEKKMNYCF